MGSVHVSVDRAEIVKSAFCPHAPRSIFPRFPCINGTHNYFTVVHRFPGERGGKRERGRDEWIRIILIVAGRRGSRPCHFPIFGYVCIHTLDYFVPAVVDFSTGKKSDRSFVSNFLKLWVEVKAITKFSESFFPTASNAWKESSANRWFSCSYFLKQQQDATRKDGFEFRRWRYFLELKKENESRGTKEREERTNSSQTIKTNDPVALLVHSFAKINCGMTTDPTK